MRRLVVLLGVFVGAALTAPVSAIAHGKVYTSTNATAGNAVQVFRAGDDGRLNRIGRVPTGGKGTGAALGSQGAVTLSSDGRWLFVVNAGSNSLTVFKVTHHGLWRSDVVSSHGVMPISVTQRGRLVYVVNAGSGTIAGFRLHDGDLGFITGSVRALSAPDAGPAQISFRPGGGALVVTEKTTNLIATFRLQSNGTAASGTFHPSSGQTPFGFAFARDDTLVVSEAFGGMPAASATSSYRVGPSGGLTTLTGSVENGETAACWVAITRDDRFAFVANTGSGTVSSYRIGPFGGLYLARARAGLTGAGSAPADEALGQADRFLYVVDGGNQQIDAFRVMGGMLHALGSSPVASAATAGLAAS
jgi:6-phosphogluconolactonase